jgi:O-methyltransferase involved in polyketide biosynthesis
LKVSLPDHLRLPALTLAAHAYESKRTNGIVTDRTAERWFRQLLDQYEIESIPLPELELTNGIITRSIVIDFAILNFVSDRQALFEVIDLGCGFSTRKYRLAISSNCSWIHVDLPDVLECRLDFQPLNRLERAVSQDLTDLRNWPIAAFPEHMGKQCFILEGVLNHLAKEHAQALVGLLHARYPGSKVIGTVITENGLRGAQSLASDLGLGPAMWAIEDQDELPDVLGLKPDRVWLLGKVASRIGLIRPMSGDEASGLAFMASL